MNENDFKYVIQDISSTQIGARFTYEEMLMSERIPLKFQSIINIYILREMKYKNPTDEYPEKTEIGKHILSLKAGNIIYDTYKRLKLKIRFCVPDKKGAFKVKQLGFDSFIDFVAEYEKENDLTTIVLQDITISNLSLMTFSV